jgi:hypothetical protein
MSVRGTLAAASLALSASVAATASATDKVRCMAAYEQGQELRRQDKLSASRAQLLICSQTCPKTLAADCMTWKAEVEALMPTVRLRARDARGHLIDARVLVDGTLLVDKLTDEPVPVDSGDHTFRFETPSGDSAEIHVSLHGGERAREIEAVVAPLAATDVTPASPATLPTSALVLGAVGGIALSLAVVLSVKGHIDAARLQSTCAPRCSPGDVDAIDTQYNVAWVSGGLGVAALGAALFLWAPWHGVERPSVGRWFVAPTLGGAIVGGFLP